MFLAAILAPFALPAAPPEWYRVASDADAVVYVARQSTLGGDSRIASVATFHAKPPTGAVAITLATQSFRCSRRDVSDLRVSLLDSAGGVIETRELPLTEPYRPIAAKSSLDAAIRFVCEGQGGTRVEDPRADAQELLAR